MPVTIQHGTTVGGLSISMLPHDEIIEEVQSVTSRASYKFQEEVQSVWQGTVQERVDSIAASPIPYLVRRPAKNVISPPHPPPKKNTHPQKHGRMGR